jgi:hypothetical protein
MDQELNKKDSLVECSQCGKIDEPYIIFSDLFLGKVCKICFDEITECTPQKNAGVLSPALQKAHEARKVKAEEKRQLKEEQRQAKRERDPEKYDRIQKIREEALRKAREARFNKKKEEQLVTA